MLKKKKFAAFACGYAIAPAPFVEKTILSILNHFCTFVENQLAILVWVHSVFSILFH